MKLPGGAGNVQRLVDDHYVSLYRYAFRLAGSSADAEDLTQEAFCQAQLKLGQLRDPARAKAWLYSILRTVARGATGDGQQPQGRHHCAKPAQAASRGSACSHLERPPARPVKRTPAALPQ